MTDIRLQIIKTKGYLYHYGHFIHDFIMPCIHYIHSNSIKLKHIYLDVREPKYSLKSFKSLAKKILNITIIEYTKDNEYIKKIPLVKLNPFEVGPYKPCVFNHIIPHIKKTLILPESSYKIILIERGISPLIIDSGANRRKLNNHEDIKNILYNKYGHMFKNIILENISIEEQVSLFMNASVVIGQHGAGLCNIIWMSNPNSLVIEFPPYRYDTFKNMCISKKIKYSRIKPQIDLIINEISNKSNLTELTLNTIQETIKNDSVIKVDKSIQNNLIDINNTEPQPIIKTIYILWFQGFKNAPGIVKLCLESWKYHNSDWNIITLDTTNLHNYINYKTDFIDISQKNIPHAAMSDIIRIILLKKYGGIWVDATTFCTKPLNEWIEEYIKTGFFAFKNPGHALLSSWFLYGNPNNFIIKKWFNAVVNYWIKHNEPHTYFWFHDTIFTRLFNNNANFKVCWNNVLTYLANSPKSPHYLTNRFLKNINNNIKKNIIHSPLYKLSHKYDTTKYDFNILKNDKQKILYYLYNSIKLQT